MTNTEKNRLAELRAQMRRWIDSGEFGPGVVPTHEMAETVAELVALVEKEQTELANDGRRKH